MSNIIDKNDNLNNSNNLDNLDNSDNSDFEMELYKDCESIDTLNLELYIYAPKNKLDVDLFNTIINSDLLKKKNITIPKEIYNSFCFCEQFSIGNICLSKAKYNVCNKCKLIIPYDMDFYSNKLQEELNNALNDDDDNDKNIDINEYNLCRCCYKNNEIYSNKLNLVKISSGFDNICDWIKVFIINKYYYEYGFKMSYEYVFYCNLNKNSIHYKKFALSSYVEMLGEEFSIIEETNLENILLKYLK